MSDTTKVLDGRLTISRDSNDVFHVRIQDVNSRNEFVELYISPEQLMMAISGLGGVPATFTVENLDIVGKNKVIKRFSVDLPAEIDHSNRQEVSQWIEEYFETTAYFQDGWEVNAYLGSKNSMVFDWNLNIHTINATMVRYE